MNHRGRTDEGVAGQRRHVGMVVVMTIAALMDLIDTTIVNVALPSIRRDLGATGAELEWIISAYLLAFAVTLVTAGRIGDRFGRKSLFLVGVVVFAAASLTAALAQGALELIAARALQGIGAAVLIPQVLATFRTVLPSTQRRTAFAIYGVVAGLASGVGVLLGGALTSANLFGTGWRAIFLVNLPIAAAVIVIGLRLVPPTRALSAAKPDLAGNAILIFSLLAIVYPLQGGRELGWPAWCFALLAAGLIGLGALAIVEARRGDAIAPLLQPKLFRTPAYGIGLLVQMLSSAGLLALFFAFSLWAQFGERFSPIVTGVTLLAFTAGGFVTGGISATLVARLGRLVLSAGAVLLAVGSLFLLLVTRQSVGAINPLVLAPGLLIAGAGLGLLVVPLVNVVLSSIPSEHASGASAVFITGQQIGGSLGVALGGTIFFAASGAGNYRHALDATLAAVAGAYVVCAVLCLVALPNRAASDLDPP